MSIEGGVTVGVDIGTTSVKAVAAAADGTVLARVRLPHDVRTGMAGQFEHDIDQAWRSNVLRALDEVAAGLPVDAVTVSAMVPSLGAVTAAGRAAGPGLLYGDRRGVRPGPMPIGAGDSGELLAFLAWQAAHHPDAHGFWPAQAVANHSLCGRGVIDSTTAMTAHPLFDLVGWDESLAKAAGTTPDHLPEIVSGVEPAGRVTGDGPAAGALVGGGTIDAFAEQLVAGAEGTGDVLVLCGTTLITWGVIDEWHEVPGLWTIPHSAPGKVLIGGPSNAGGLFLDHARRWLGEGAAARVGSVAPEDLPVWLPYVRGERTPLHRRDLGASLHHAGLHHGPEHVLRAAYEAAGFVVRHHLDLGREAGLEPKRIVATGGGTQVAAWMQALADCTNLPVDVAQVPEGAALGAAFLARCTAGHEASMLDAKRWARTARTLEPDERWVGPAQERYERFRSLTQQALDS